MGEPRLSVLFLCTGNSARSQMAEALLRHVSKGRIDVESAGTAPQADIHPMARRAVDFVRHVTRTIVEEFARGPVGLRHPAHDNVARFDLPVLNEVPAS